MRKEDKIRKSNGSRATCATLRQAVSRMKGKYSFDVRRWTSELTEREFLDFYFTRPGYVCKCIINVINHVILNFIADLFHLARIQTSFIFDPN